MPLALEYHLGSRRGEIESTITVQLANINSDNMARKNSLYKVIVGGHEAIFAPISYPEFRVNGWALGEMIMKSCNFFFIGRLCNNKRSTESRSLTLLIVKKTFVCFFLYGE